MTSATLRKPPLIIKSRLFLALLCILLSIRIILLFLTLEFPPGYDARSYILAAQAIRAGYSPYDESTWNHLPVTVSASKYLYPPFLAVLLIPLTTLPLIPATYICILLALLSACLLAVMLHHLAGWRLAILAVFGFPPAWHSIYLGQINLIVTVVLMFALGALDAQRERRIGGWLALGALLKLTPLLSLYVLVIRGYRRALVAAAAVIALSVVLTLPVVDVRLWVAGGIAAVRQSWTAPDLVSWTGLLAYLLNGTGEALGFGLSVCLLAITTLRANKISTRMAFAAAMLLPLLIARITWEHHAVMALPALAILWCDDEGNRPLVAATWLLIAFIGGIAMPIALTCCWIVCCWPHLRIPQKRSL